MSFVISLLLAVGVYDAGKCWGLGWALWQGTHRSKPWLCLGVNEGLGVSELEVLEQLTHPNWFFAWFIFNQLQHRASEVFPLSRALTKA